VLFTCIAIVIATSCVAASLKRILLASTSTTIEPGVIFGVLRRDPAAWPEIRAEIEKDPHAEWERAWIEALGARAEVRTALTNEQLSELDYRAQHWARVPRVCASIASSSGFLLASLAMRAGLASDDVDVGGAVASALNAATIGLAGAAFCVAAHLRARVVVRDRLAGIDRLVERLDGECSEARTS
jgi:hypothetical protein